MSSVLDRAELPVLYTGADLTDGGQDFIGVSDAAGDIVGVAHVGNLRKAEITSFGIRVTETCAGAGVIKLWKGAIGGTLLATINLLTTAAGKFIYKNITGVTADAGDILTIELDAKATTTGQGLFSIGVRSIPTQPSDVTNMVATT